VVTQSQAEPRARANVVNAEVLYSKTNGHATLYSQKFRTWTVEILADVGV
jgi:hypothetical protein